MKTKQGNFDEVYLHIEAPTKSDEEYWQQTHRRILRNPLEAQGNCYRTPELYFLSNNAWDYKRKLDGQNMRVKWDGNEVLWSGKSNNFVCGAEMSNYMNRTFVEEIFEEKFGREKTVLLFGEHMGPKVQGNELELDKDQFVLFDVKVGESWLLEQAQIQAVAEYFNIPTCYDFMPEDGVFCGTLNDLIDNCCHGNFVDWEGIVATPASGLCDRFGHRLIVKIKNKDYLRR